MGGSRGVDWPELASEVEEITSSIVWAVLTTVDRRCRPRGRVVHPVFKITAAGIEGVLASRPTPLKARHIAGNPFVTLSYWSPAHDAVFLDCAAEWVPGLDGKRAAWQLIAGTPPPVGYDPALIWTGGPEDGDLAVLRLMPYRVQVVRAAAMAKGEPTRIWRSLPAAQPVASG